MWRYLILPIMIALAVLFLEPSVSILESSTKLQTQSAPTLQTNSTAQPQSEFSADKEQRRKMTAETHSEEFKQLFVQASKMQQGNMQAWLQRFWANCKRQGLADCEALITQMAKQLSSSQMHWLRQALANYDAYQQAMPEQQQSLSQPFAERLELITQLRTQYFGDQTALVFGDEHRFAQYQIDLDNLHQSSSHYDVTERLERLQALQQDFKVSDNRDALISADSQYQTALSLLSDLPESERKQWQEKLRNQYFGDQAAEVAAYEQQQQQHKNQQLSYQQALQQLNEIWQHQPEGFNSAGYRQALQELRERIFN